MLRLKTLRLIALVFVLLLTQSWSGRLLAQTNKPATTPLPFNKTISGQFRGKGEKITYTFDIPIDQDVIFEYRANKLVFSGYCLYTDETVFEGEQCTQEGGSGGDRPIFTSHLITTLGEKEQHATVTLTRILDGASTYQITAYPITPQSIKFGENTVSTSTNTATYQIYTMEADPTVPFTFEAEDREADGNFLWAAYQPFAFKSFPTVEKQSLYLPEYVDGASGPNGATGINSLRVYYLGRRTFRILVRSLKSYQLYSTKAELNELNENQQIMTTVSYRQPLVAMKLNIQPGEAAQVNFNVSVGKGAIARVFEVNSLFDKGLSLGWTGADRPTFALSGNIQRTAIQALYVVVQIPFDYTRDKVNVEVKWQRVN